MAVVAGLLAARGLADGTGPTDTTPLGFTLASGLAALLGLLAWLTAGRPRLPGVGLLAGLLILAASLFVAAAVSADQATALQAAWLSLGIPAMFAAVWFLVARPAVERSLLADRFLAVLLATAVSAAVPALLPAVDPRIATLPVNEDRLALGPADELAPPVLPPRTDGLPQALGALGFDHPDTLAALLALFLPAAAAAATLGPRPVLGRLLLMLLTAGLTATGCGPAGISLVIAVGLLFTLGPADRRLSVARWITFAALLGGVAVGVALAGWPRFLEGSELTAGWQHAWSILRSRPLTGLGPGLEADASAWPAQLILAGGLLAVIAGGMTVVLAVRTWGRIIEPPSVADRESPAWPVYAGGGLGLVLAFGLRMADRAALDGPDGVLAAGVVMILRSTLWFAALAVFEPVRWTEIGRSRVIAAGVIAVALLGLGTASPLPLVVVQLLVAAVALAVASAATQGTASWLWWWCVPVVAVVLVAYVLLACLPGLEAARAAKRVRILARSVPTIEADLAKMTPAERSAEVRRVWAYVTRSVPAAYVKPGADRPGAAGVLRDTAAALVFLWQIDPVDRDRTQTVQRAVDTVKLAVAADPVSTASLRAAFHLHLRLAADRRLRKPHVAHAAKALEAITTIDPSAAARLRYAWARSADSWGDATVRQEQAELALAADEQGRTALARLTPEQREQALAWRP